MAISFLSYLSVVAIIFYRIAPFQPYISAILGFFSLFYIVAILLNGKSEKFPSYLNYILIAPLISACIMVPLGIADSESALNRVIHLAMLIPLAIFYYSHTEKVIRAFIAIMILLTMYGYYQFFGFFFDLPFSDFDWTRNKLTGINTDIRVTSLFNEPSFYSPLLLISMFAAYFLLKSYFLAVFFFIQLILTMSLGGYIALLASITYFLLANKRFGILLFLLSIFVVALYNSYFYDRLIYEFSENGSVIYRLTESFVMFDLFSEYPVLMPFGLGPGGYQYASLWLHGYVGDGSSNNTFSDVSIEYGVFGLIVYAYIFMWLLVVARKSKQAMIFYVLFLTVNLFKGAFVQPEFFFFVALIIFFSKVDRIYFIKRSI